MTLGPSRQHKLDLLSRPAGLNAALDRNPHQTALKRGRRRQSLRTGGCGANRRFRGVSHLSAFPALSIATCWSRVSCFLWAISANSTGDGRGSGRRKSRCEGWWLMRLSTFMSTRCQGLRSRPVELRAKGAYKKTHRGANCHHFVPSSCRVKNEWKETRCRFRDGTCLAHIV